MARFSLGGEDDGEEGPSYDTRPGSKKRKTLASCFDRSQKKDRHSTGNECEVQEEEVIVVIADKAEEEEEEETGEEEEEEYGCDEEEEGDEQEAGQTLNNQAGKTSNGNGLGKRNRNLEGSSGNGCISVFLTDPDVLDCPICLDHLSIPVFQCENGHIACESCCVQIANKCPSCSWPIGYNRCRAIEKVLESVKVSCQNLKHGCLEKIYYSKKREHESACIFAPCSCPFQDCDFVGSSKDVYTHVGSLHFHSARRFIFNHQFSIDLCKSQKYLILQEAREGIVFVINNYSERHGNLVSIVCVGPTYSRTRFSYDLMAREEGSFVKLRSNVEFIPKGFENSLAKKLLLVPSDFIPDSGQMKLDISIQRQLGRTISTGNLVV